MGEGQVPKKVKCHTLSSTFSTASNDTRCLHRVLASVGIANRKERYVG